MNVNEAVEYINDPKWNTTEFGLERTEELLERLGSPHKRLKFIHVAGSNGKGSVCALTESVLRFGGYKTGFYLSPPVNGFNESFQAGGRDIDDAALCEITEKVRNAAEQMKEHPTQFEIKTAVGMLFFERAGCDIVLLETGMGGELDSTNVIPPPEAAIITNIGMEHTDYLGNTLAQIASAKAGIIKTGCDVVCYDNTDEVKEVISAVCEKRGCDLRYAGIEDVSLLSKSIKGQEFIWKAGNLRLEMPLLGEHQLKNAAVVLGVISVLRRKGWNISDESIIKGFMKVKWPARFEVLRYNPVFILDGGHNPQCAKALADTLKEYLPDRKLAVIFGVLADKDYMKMIDEAAPHASEFICYTPDSPRALEAEKLSAILNEKGYSARAVKTPKEAVEYALSAGKDVIAFGSLNSAGIIRKFFV